MTTEFYAVPEKKNVFDADEAVRIRLIEAGNAATKLIADWMQAYDKFWMTPLTHGDRALTKEQTQAMLHANPAAIGEVLLDSGRFRDFVKNAHPGKIGDGADDLVPNRYMSTPYDIDKTLTLTSDLKDEWKAPTEEE